MLLNNECVNNEIKEEIKTNLETNENRNRKLMGHRKSSNKKEIHSITGLLQETNKKNLK